jgi:beta-N-acetylhexosaminidase
MTAHVTYAAIDPTRPGTISEQVVRVVRDRIGFDGLLMTDDISMGALPGSLSFRVRASLAAGCDAILHCNGELPEMETVAAEAGRMSGAAEARTGAALSRRRAPEAFDVREARAELAGLCNPTEDRCEVLHEGRPRGH